MIIESNKTEFSVTASDGPTWQKQQGCQEELVLRVVFGSEGGQGGGRDARCHRLPPGARTAAGAFQGHAAGELNRRRGHQPLPFHLALTLA